MLSRLRGLESLIIQLEQILLGFSVKHAVVLKAYEFFLQIYEDLATLDGATAYGQSFYR